MGTIEVDKSPHELAQDYSDEHCHEENCYGDPERCTVYLHWMNGYRAGMEGANQLRARIKVLSDSEVALTQRVKELEKEIDGWKKMLRGPKRIST